MSFYYVANSSARCVKGEYDPRGRSDSDEHNRQQTRQCGQPHRAAPLCLNGSGQAARQGSANDIRAITAARSAGGA